jgi:hypothetical protein
VPPDIVQQSAIADLKQRCSSFPIPSRVPKGLHYPLSFRFKQDSAQG